MYPVLSFAFFVFLPKIQEHKQVALPISVHKHLSCATFNIRLATYTWSVLATGSGNAGTCEKLHDRSRIRQKAGVCASGLKPTAFHLLELCALLQIILQWSAHRKLLM
jgi:hypothetical protein